MIKHKYMCTFIESSFFRSHLSIWEARSTMVFSNPFPYWMAMGAGPPGFDCRCHMATAPRDQATAVVNGTGETWLQILRLFCRILDVSWCFKHMIEQIEELSNWRSFSVLLRGKARIGSRTPAVHHFTSCKIHPSHDQKKYVQDSITR